MVKVYCNLKSDCLNVDGDVFLGCDVVVFGFNGLKTVNYKEELSGKSCVLPSFANLSKKYKKVFISGACTDNYGIIRKSCVVADSGKLLGISDMSTCLEDGDLSCGCGYKVYYTSVGKIGISVGSDIIDADGVKAMALCNADLIINVSDNFAKSEEHFLLPAYSYIYGVPMISITKNMVTASDINGEICGKSPQNETLVTVPSKKSFRLVTVKRRGVKIL